ncbi:threonine synthase [Anaerolinea sp.]|uniref:threonine synthase n=1 Tax=Anaerolinea sp. TaxID=1872519 RepID=UPI00260C198B|nr:threonine synthase [uncultured Anaerolinea sp.]
MTRATFQGYRCSLCGADFAPQDWLYTCPHDGGNLDIVLDYSAIRQQVSPRQIAAQADPSLWRYLPLLPVNDPNGWGTPLRTAGWTPLYSPPALQAETGLPALWVKDEGKNPTASFKDRASAVVVARARQMGAEVVVTASTGNAGAALAGMAAAVGHRAVIFAPRTAPPAKIAQLLVFGAQVILVDGNYDHAFDLTVQAAQEFGWYCRNTGYNPFTVEGKKTAALEIFEQVILPNRLKRPLCVFVSVGDGNIISGIHKGFKDLQELGWLDTMPRLFGVQSTGSAAVANAYFAGTEEIIPVQASTLADSISVDLPRDGVRAVRAARQTGGAYILVSDDAILQAIAALGKAGIFADPAGATAYAGLLEALKNGQIYPDDPVVVINTGSGLKDVRSAMRAVPEAPIIEPSLDALKRLLSQNPV